MSFYKGMRITVAKSKSQIEQFKIKTIYTQFIDVIPMCVKSFEEWKEYERERNDN